LNPTPLIIPFLDLNYAKHEHTLEGPDITFFYDFSSYSQAWLNSACLLDSVYADSKEIRGEITRSRALFV
jgi:hypothetical protein